MALETSVPQCGNYNQLADSQKPAPPPSAPSILSAVPKIVRLIQHPHNYHYLLMRLYRMRFLIFPLPLPKSCHQSDQIPHLLWNFTTYMASFPSMDNPRKHSHLPLV